MAQRPSALGTALRIAMVSSPALDSAGTALTSLFLVPMLEVLLVVTLSAAIGTPELVTTAYSSVLVALGLSVLAGTVGQISWDRGLGVLHEIISVRFFLPTYWASKVAIPMLVGSAVAVVSAVTVYVVDPDSDAAALRIVLLLIPLVVVAGALSGIAAATISVALRDPYIVANIAQAGLMITAGVVAPIASYPKWLAVLASGLPMTATVEALRAGVSGSGGTTVALFAVRELLVCAGWLGVGVVASRWVGARLRSGHRDEELW